MRCVIPGGNVKILAKAIHMLAKIGDEMYVNPQQESISFRTVNMAKSAYCDFTFYKNFFSYYTLGDLEEEEAQKCKISMRSAMTIFKFAHTLDKQVETCHIHLDVNACDLVFTLKYRNGINKSHLSPILDDEKLQASYDKTGMTNELTSQARTLVDALQNFQQNLLEITLEVTPQKLLLRNYVDDTSVNVNITRTQLALGIGEFDRYTIGNETIITFCVKEFKALLTFCESAGVSFSAHFESAGRPVLFTFKSQVFEANLLLSTLSPDSDSQSETTAVSKQVHSVRKKSRARSTSTRRNDKSSSSRIKKPTIFAKPTTNETSNGQIEKKCQVNEVPNRAENNISMEVKKNNSLSDVRERSQAKPVQNRLFALSPSTTTSSTTRKEITKNHRELVNSVFSSLTKRKSTSDKEDRGNEDTVGITDFDKSTCSPPRQQITKKAKLVFQKCFQTTFDPCMLPGHDTILVEDSDENNSD